PSFLTRVSFLSLHDALPIYIELFLVLYLLIMDVQPGLQELPWSNVLISGRRLYAVEQKRQFSHGVYLFGAVKIFFSLPDFSVKEDRKSTRLNSSHVSISYAV